MAMTVNEIRAWLNTFTDDTLIGIGEDEMTLQPADARYDEAYLEIGMALSSQHLNLQAYIAGQPLPYPDRTPIGEHTPECVSGTAGPEWSGSAFCDWAWECDECGAIIPTDDILADRTFGPS